jgi:hypothetical protein
MNMKDGPSSLNCRIAGWVRMKKRDFFLPASPLSKRLAGQCLIICMDTKTGRFIRPLLVFLWGGALVVLPLGAAPGVVSDLLWTGSWEPGSSLVNRGDLRLSFPGFMARIQATDRRSTREEALPLWEHPGEGLSALGGGLYHRSTGSRLLYGIIDEWGLSARLRNSWAKSPPLVETRERAGANLKTEPSATGIPEAYLYLASPPGGIFRAYTTLQAGADLAPSLGGGLEAAIAKGTALGVEGFYTGKTLEAYQPGAWFSESPPLPERDFRLGGLSLFFSAPLLGVAADGAYSETFAFGRGFYGNLALRLGERPWRLSLSAEGAGSRFTGRDGDAPGRGFRGAARLERRGRGQELLRLGTVLSSGGFGEPFDRLSALASYRFPAGSGALRPGTIRVEAGRNGTEPGKILDTLEGSLSFGWGKFRPVLEGALGAYAGAESGGGYRFQNARAAAEIAYYGGLLQGRFRLGRTGTAGKPPFWETTLAGSIRGGPGRLSLSLSSPDFPRAWTCSLSWRLGAKIAQLGNGE